VNQSLIAVRYAKALFKLGLERGTLAILHGDLNAVAQVITDSSDLSSLLTSPLVKPSKKKEFFDSLLRTRISKDSLSFLFLVIEKKREDILMQIIRDFGDLYRGYKGIKSVTFISATPLDLDFQKHLELFLRQTLKAEIELKVIIKAELLGGFVLMVDGKLMDASIAHQLRQIKKQLLN
jgi:F-type H+-transporting ATPase subunit delta